VRNQPATPRHVAPASQTFPLLHQRPPPAPGETETGFTFQSSAFPPLQCCMCAQLPGAGMELSTSSWQTGLLETSTSPALCQSSPQSVMSWTSLSPPRHELHRKPTASASAVASPIGTCQKYLWGGELVQPESLQSTALPATGMGGKHSALLQQAFTLLTLQTRHSLFDLPV